MIREDYAVTIGANDIYCMVAYRWWARLQMGLEYVESLNDGGTLRRGSPYFARKLEECSAMMFLALLNKEFYKKEIPYESS